MATSPFSTASFTYPGQGTPRDRAYSPTYRPFWLGPPGALVQLPAPATSYEADPDRGEVAHKLLSGAAGVTRRLHEKRTWQFTWKRLQGRDLQVLQAFYRGAFGDGPFCLLQPSDRNKLSLDSSLCGTRFALLGQWSISTGVPVVDLTQTANIAPGSWMKWTSPVNTSRLFLGSQPAGVFTPDLLSAAAYVPDAAWTASMWAKTATGTATVSCDMLGLTAAGSATPVTTSHTYTLTTTPQLLQVTVAAGAGGWSPSATPYILPSLKCTQASSPNIFVTNAQLEYGVSTASAWEAGAGFPRVSISAPQTRAVDGLYASDVTLQFSEI